jgi:hypothetical protein
MGRTSYARAIQWKSTAEEEEENGERYERETKKTGEVGLKGVGMMDVVGEKRNYDTRRYDQWCRLYQEPACRGIAE